MKLEVSPSMCALIKSDFLRHSDDEIKLMVTSYLSEIVRISAPKSLYNDNTMKDILQLIEESFHRLDDTRKPYFDRRVRILETFANVRSYVVMIDIKCDDLILRIFQCFFAKIRKYHAENVITTIQTIFYLVLDEENDISRHILSNLFSIGRKEQVVSPISHELSKGLVEQKIENIKYQLTEEELISLCL
jgi:sister-chromatid-cohesion protein PDS5